MYLGLFKKIKHWQNKDNHQTKLLKIKYSSVGTMILQINLIRSPIQMHLERKKTLMIQIQLILKEVEVMEYLPILINKTKVDFNLKEVEELLIKGVVVILIREEEVLLQAIFVMINGMIELGTFKITISLQLALGEVELEEEGEILVILTNKMITLGVEEEVEEEEVIKEIRVAEDMEIGMKIDLAIEKKGDMVEVIEEVEVEDLVEEEMAILIQEMMILIIEVEIEILEDKLVHHILIDNRIQTKILVMKLKITLKKNRIHKTHKIQSKLQFNLLYRLIKLF